MKTKEQDEKLVQDVLDLIKPLPREVVVEKCQAHIPACTLSPTHTYWHIAVLIAYAILHSDLTLTKLRNLLEAT